MAQPAAGPRRLPQLFSRSASASGQIETPHLPRCIREQHGNCLPQSEPVLRVIMPPTGTAPDRERSNTGTAMSRSGSERKRLSSAAYPSASKVKGAPLRVSRARVSAPHCRDEIRHRTIAAPCPRERNSARQRVGQRRRFRSPAGAVSATMNRWLSPALAIAVSAAFWRYPLKNASPGSGSHGFLRRSLGRS